MQTNIIFIDDSGNIRLTNFLVICMVIFDNEVSAAFTTSIIEKLRENRFRRVDTEFHFNKESLARKKVFFNSLKNSSFKIKYYICDKDTEGEFLTHLKELFHRYAIDIHSSRIYLDGKISKLQKKNIIKGLYTSMTDFKPLSIKFVNSKTHVLIQLADMCAGCIRRKLERNTVDDNKLYDLIRKFIIET